MPFDTDSTTAFAGNRLSLYTSTCDDNTTGATLGAAVMYIYSTSTSATTNITWGNCNTGGFYSTSMQVRGFRQRDIAAVREDYDAVKKDWKRRRAEVRARRFLRDIIGAWAYKHYRRRGWHEVRGSSGTRYRLRPGMRVQVMKHPRKGEEVSHELCAHLDFGIPWYDSMVIQHLMLTSNKESEEQFVAVANRHDAHGPYPIRELEAAA